MSDSSIDDELFAEEKIAIGMDKVDATKLNINLPPYYKTAEFQKFTQENNIQPDLRHGYIQLFLYRQYYFPGQTVRGFAIIDLFNDINSNKIHIRVKGKEKPGKHSEEISRRFLQQPENFNHKQFNTQ